MQARLALRGGALVLERHGGRRPLTLRVVRGRLRLRYPSDAMTCLTSV